MARHDVGRRRKAREGKTEEWVHGRRGEEEEEGSRLVCFGGDNGATRPRKAARGRKEEIGCMDEAKGDEERKEGGRGKEGGKETCVRVNWRTREGRNEGRSRMH